MGQLTNLFRKYSKAMTYFSLLLGSGVFSHLLTGEYANDGGRLQVALSAKLFLASSYAISAIMIFSFWQDLKNKHVLLVWLWLALILWTIFSVAAGQLSTLTMMRLSGAIGCTLIGVMMYGCFKQIADAVEVIFWTCITVLIINLIYIDWPVLLSFSSENVKGVFIQKNSLGHVSFLTIFISGFFFFYKKGWNRLISLIAFLVALWLLFISTSMTSNFLVLITVYSVFASLVLTYNRKGKLIIGVLTPILITLLALNWNSLFNLVGKSTYLTGRTNHWDAYWSLIEQNWWMGHGYGAYPFSEPQTYWITLGPHSGYIESLYYLGIVGLILISAIFMLSFRCAWSCLKNKTLAFDTSFAITFLSVFLALNITETYMLNRSGLFWPIFVYVTLQLAYLNKHKTETS